jgi:anti-sigma B factor antagonist
MPINTSRLQVQRQGDVTIVGFLDRNILEETSIQQIGEEISRIIDESDTPKLLLFFGSVEHLSSAALTALITINNKVRQRGGQLRLSNIGAHIYEVFSITKLNKLFQIHDTAESAIQSFRS